MALPVEIGERFAERYVVSHIAGGGGMSVVVGARHDRLGQLMAVKFLTVPAQLGREAVQRFLQEARAVASLRSEHIVRVTDAGTDEKGRHFIAMEYLEGSDLARLLRENGPVEAQVAVGYILHACEGLAEAHAVGIVHRDLKPANLFATQRIDGTPLIKVLDFGISKITNVTGVTSEQILSHRDLLLGTPAYMAPEQLRTPNEVDARTDVWALGLILFELLTGKNPFAAPTAPEIFAAVLAEGDPPSADAYRSDLPPGLSDVIARCLRRDPVLRTASVGVLASELMAWSPPWAHEAGYRAARMCQSDPAAEPERAQAPVSPVGSDQTSHATPVGISPRASIRSVRGRLFVGLAGVLLVAAVLVLRSSGRAPETKRDAQSPAASVTEPPGPSAPAPAVSASDHLHVPPAALPGAVAVEASRQQPDVRRPRRRAKTKRGGRGAAPASEEIRTTVSDDPLAERR